MMAVKPARVRQRRAPCLVTALALATLSMLYACAATGPSLRSVNVALVGTTSVLGRERIANGLLAFAHLNNKTDGWWDDVLPDVFFNVSTTFAARCNEASAIATAESQYRTRNIAAFIGPGCSPGASAANFFLSLFSVPHICYSASSTDMSNKAKYPYFFRTVPGNAVDVLGLARVCAAMNWRRVGMLYAVGDVGQGAADAFNVLAPLFNISIVTQTSFSDTIDQEAAVEWIHRASISIILVVGAGSVQIQNIFRYAASKGMTRPGYQWLLTSSFLNSAYFVRNGVIDTITVDSYLGAITLKENIALGSFYARYIQEWQNVDPSVYFDGDGDRSHIDSGPEVYDAVLAYALALDRVTKRGLNETHRLQVIAELRMLQFEGASGPVSFDANQDRLGLPYDIYNYQQKITADNAGFKVVGRIEREVLSLNPPDKIVWYANATDPPHDGKCAGAPVECSGRGTCRHEDRMCLCYTSYTGANCASQVAADAVATQVAMAPCGVPVLYAIRNISAGDTVSITLKPSGGAMGGPFPLNVTVLENSLNVSSARATTLVNAGNGIYEYTFVATAASLLGLGLVVRDKACPLEYELSVVKTSPAVVPVHVDACDLHKALGVSIFAASDVAVKQRAGVAVLAMFCVLFSAEVIITPLFTRRFSLILHRKSIRQVDRVNTMRATMANVVRLVVLCLQALQVHFIVLSADTVDTWVSRAFGFSGGAAFGGSFYWYFWLIMSITLLWITYATIFVADGGVRVSRTVVGRTFLIPADQVLQHWVTAGFIPTILNGLRAFHCWYLSGATVTYMVADGVCDVPCWTARHWPYIAVAFVAVLAYYPFATVSGPMWQDLNDQLDVRYRPESFLVEPAVKVVLVVMRAYFTHVPRAYFPVVAAASGSMAAYHLFRSPCCVTWVNVPVAASYLSASLTALLLFAGVLSDEGSKTLYGTPAIWAACIAFCAVYLWRFPEPLMGKFVSHRSTRARRMLMAMRSVFKPHNIHASRVSLFGTTSINDHNSILHSAGHNYFLEMMAPLYIAVQRGDIGEPVVAWFASQWTPTHSPTWPALLFAGAPEGQGKAAFVKAIAELAACAGIGVEPTVDVAVSGVNSANGANGVGQRSPAWQASPQRWRTHPRDDVTVKEDAVEKTVDAHSEGVDPSPEDLPGTVSPASQS